MKTDDILQLQEPLTDGGIRAVNFFNGRLLTGKDFSREQDARREADSRLGLALGEGIAFGLEVEHDNQLSQSHLPVVNIKAGLAFNREGQALRLKNPVHVALARSFEVGSVDCLFKNCTVLGGGTYVAGAGVYVLTIAPAASSEGRAASNGLDPGNVRCNTDTTVEAVQFRLLQVKPAWYADLNVAAPSFRNQLAYRCFGAGIHADWFENLLGAAPRQDDLLETLRKNLLSPLEVPLGLLFFTGAADLKFIDMWAVRRPLNDFDSDPLMSLVGSRRLAIGQAMFMQFQQQIAVLLDQNADPESIIAADYFRFLPPVGIIPLLGNNFSKGFHQDLFFDGIVHHPIVYIEAARAEALMRHALHYPPIDIKSRVMVRIYRVRENAQTITNASQTGTLRPYVIFSSGHMAYMGDPHFDVNRWDFSNWA